MSPDRPDDQSLGLARNIVNQLFDEAEVPVEKRQAINDQCDQFVAGLLRDWAADAVTGALSRSTYEPIPVDRPKFLDDMETK